MKEVKQRQCAGCGEYRNGKEMFRIVKTPEGEIVYDPTGRKNGRGVYICKDAACLERAAAKGGIARSLHMQIPGQTIRECIDLCTEEMKNIEE